MDRLCIISETCLIKKGGMPVIVVLRFADAFLTRERNSVFSARNTL